MYKIRILGVPLDLGQERRGVDMGPSAVRVAGINQALASLGHEVEDGGNIHVRLPEQQHFGDHHAKYLKEIAETSHEVAQRVYDTLEAGYFPLSLGGDHSMAVGTQAGVAKFYHDHKQEVGCLWIDAHADMNTPETSPSGNVHGMPFAASLGHGPDSLTHIFGFAPKLRPEKCALIGIRDLDAHERQVVRASGVDLFTMREIDELGMRIVMERALAVASKGTAGFVVSFDMDVVDPDEAPGVGTPVRGGITFREAHLAMEMVADTGKMRAFELVEINPIIDVMNKTAILGVGFAASALGKENPVTKKIRVAVLFGGRSGEHDVSLQSATSVIDALDPVKYEIVPIGITREGHWRVARDSRQSPAQVLVSGKPAVPSVDPTGPKLLPVAGTGSRTHSLPSPDVVFPVLHGTFGEDGTVQGLLELADVPYVGAGVLGSAAGMDKDVMKRLLRDAGLPVVPWELIHRADWGSHPDAVRKRIEKELRYPLFVKPANLGSSVGISKVHNRRELAAALNLASQYDRRVLVEKGIDAREIECSVLGNEHPQASVPGEVVPINEFYDYEAKYIKEGSKLLIPASLTVGQTKRVREVAIRAFLAVDAAGMGRVDFLVDRRSGKVYLNEINTIPGFTSISMYPKLWEASGLPYSQLLDRLIELAFERHQEKARTRFTYSRTSHN